MKRKICVYVSEELVTRLATAAEKRGATKSGLVGSALDRFLDITEDHDTSSSVDDRLARMGDQLDHLARELSVVNETVAMHARYHLAVTPPLSDTEQPAACRLGAARFDEFAAQVARRVRQGKPLFHETLERLEAQVAPLPSSDDESISGASAERTHDAIYNRFGETDREPVTPGIARQISDEPAADGEQQPKQGQPSRLRLILRVFLPFAIGYYLSYLFRTISALIAGPLTDEFGLTSSTLGLLTSAYFLTFAAAQIPIGILLDRHGPRQVQAVLLVLAAGGAALFGAADGVFSLLAGRALIGLGVAAALTAGLKATVLWFPKEHVALVNGWMVMLGALGAVTATAPSEWLLAWIGWRGLFEWLAMATTVAAGIVYLLVPEAPSSAAGVRPIAGFREIYGEPRFWRLAPLSATTIGTAWGLQGLWAAPWLSDVEGLDRAEVVDHLFAMALALSFGAVVLGIVANRLRKRNVQPHAAFGVVAALFIATQFALILRWPLPSYIPWCFMAAVGATTVLSFASVADYFPKELAGRATAALNVFHIGGAFLLQNLIGIIVNLWPGEGIHRPILAYQAAFGVDLAFQVAACIWFMWPRAEGKMSGSVRPFSVETIAVKVHPLRA